jgi:hypothetical protein
MIDNQCRVRRAAPYSSFASGCSGRNLTRAVRQSHRGQSVGPGEKDGRLFCSATRAHFTRQWTMVVIPTPSSQRQEPRSLHSLWITYECDNFSNMKRYGSPAAELERNVRRGEDAKWHAYFWLAKS